MRAGPRVVMVGAGLMEASATWHLTRAGVPVTVLDRERAAGGAMRWSFGWLGAASRRPSADPGQFAMILRALGDVRRLDRAQRGSHVRPRA